MEEISYKMKRKKGSEGLSGSAIPVSELERNMTNFQSSICKLYSQNLLKNNRICAENPVYFSEREKYKGKHSLTQLIS